MNPWDIDPDLYLPMYRAVYRMLRASLRKLLALRTDTPRPAGCRG
jgi:hypothetical protein